MFAPNSSRIPSSPSATKASELLDGDGDHRLAANGPALGAAGVSRTDVVAIDRITLADH
jgi:hypothetical protein